MGENQSYAVDTLVLTKHIRKVRILATRIRALSMACMACGDSAQGSRERIEERDVKSP